ncbi:kelch repeat-containing protein [Sorangium sp. So ce367]|uniref:Kelch repeat-containing protein n=1 Tax=Sorangium sp. So ce367 TaxID=3133305 RepID=UPI003F5E0382
MRSIGRLGSAAAWGFVMLCAGVASAASAPSWESAPPMITPRGEHTATVLKDGRVLVAGGYPELDGPPYTTREAMSLKAVEIYDPATGTWSPAAPLLQARSGHAAILLPDGHVLVAGGRMMNAQAQGTSLSSAEIYDPMSDTWTPAGPLSIAHPAPSMMLAGGRPVLVGLAWQDVYDEFDGQFVLHYYQNAAIYDPESRGWTDLPHCDAVDRWVRLPYRPQPVSATLLQDGRVMVAGGGCSLYDLETQLWTWELGAVKPTTELAYPGATTLPGGGVLVVGGTLPAGSAPEIHAFSQLYLPQDDRWEPTPGPYAPASSPCGQDSSGIQGMRTSLLPSGKVLLTGGVEPCRSAGSTASVVPFYATQALFDEATLSWSSLDLAPPVTMARAYHSSTRLNDGSVLIAGGYVDAATATASAVVFRERSPLGEGCDADSDCGSGFCADSVCCDAACAGPCDACTAASGASQDGVCTPLTGVACDDTEACVVGGVCEAGACVDGAAAPDGTPCSDGDVCSAASACVGGACVESSLAVCLPVDDCHEAPVCDPAAGCAAPASAKPDGALCDFPGSAEGWQATGRMGVLLNLPAATLLQDGTLLMIGYGETGNPPRWNDVWLCYDPSTGSWQPPEKMNVSRRPSRLVTLPDGTVLGIANSVLRRPSQTVRFDPATGVWAPAAPTLVSRQMTDATVTPLADGRVLVASGDGNVDGGGEKVEIYDSVTDTWTLAAPMNVPRSRARATLLQDGRVLVTGGDRQSQRMSAEIYDAATNTWTRVASMRWSRSSHEATLLLDGRVLVLGGRGSGGDNMKTGEIYDPASDTWTSTGEMVEQRGYPSAALLADGRVLVMGLPSASGANDGAFAAELYDPASDTWTPAPALDVMHQSAVMERLHDGRILIAGGGTTYQRLDHAWLYVPAQPASPGMCQSGACVPGGGGGESAGAGGGSDGAGGGTTGEGGGAVSGSGGAGGTAAGGHGGGGDASGGGGGAGNGVGGGDTSGGIGGSASSGVGGHPDGSGGDASSGVGGNPGAGGGDVGSGIGGDPSGGTSGGGDGGAGGDDGAGSATSSSGAGGDDAAASATSSSGAGGGDAAASATSSSGAGGAGGDAASSTSASSASAGGGGGGSSSATAASSSSGAGSSGDTGVTTTGSASSSGGDAGSPDSSSGCSMSGDPTPAGTAAGSAWLGALGLLCWSRRRTLKGKKHPPSPRRPPFRSRSASSTP